MGELVDVAVIDDEEILLDHVADWMARGGRIARVVVTARTLEDFLRRPRTVDIVLLDLLLRDGRDPAENVGRLVAAGFTVIAMSTKDHTVRIRDAIAAGAHSYVRKAKESTELHAAVQAAASGVPYTSRVHAAMIESAEEHPAVKLSIQEREALRLYASGMTVPQAAARMNISAATAKSYIDRARRKYEEAGRAAHTKIDLRQRAAEDGLLNNATSDG
jgi:two-component system, NarL family, nitrate/nitrite response regulator NarL